MCTASVKYFLEIKFVILYTAVGQLLQTSPDVARQVESSPSGSGRLASFTFSGAFSQRQCWPVSWGPQRVLGPWPWDWSWQLCAKVAGTGTVRWKRLVSARAEESPARGALPPSGHLGTQQKAASAVPRSSPGPYLNVSQTQGWSELSAEPSTLWLDDRHHMAPRQRSRV